MKTVRKTSFSRLHSSFRGLGKFWCEVRLSWASKFCQCALPGAAMTIQVSRESDLGQTYKSTLLLLETSCFDSWIFITCQYNTQYWYGISRCRSSLLLCLYKCTRCQPFSSSGMLSVFLWPQLALQNSKGTLNGGIKYTGVGNICVSDSFRHFVLESIKISALIGSHRYLIDHCHFWWPWVTLKGVTRGAWFSGRSQHVNLYCLTNND